MNTLSLDKKSLRKFGITMGTILGLIALIIILRHKNYAVKVFSLSIFFFVLAILFPLLLKPIYIFWMKFAYILGWINTRILLSLIFYLVIAPMGLVVRLCGKDLLSRKLEKDKGSYWIKREEKEFNPLTYERQF